MGVSGKYSSACSRNGISALDRKLSSIVVSFRRTDLATSNFAVMNIRSVKACPHDFIKVATRTLCGIFIEQVAPGSARQLLCGGSAYKLPVAMSVALCMLFLPCLDNLHLTFSRTLFCGVGFSAPFLAYSNLLLG